MEDKNITIIAAIAIIIFLIIIGAFFLFHYLPRSGQPQIEPLVEANQNLTGEVGIAPSLPTSDDTLTAEQITELSQSRLEKEKQFISSFWQLISTPYTPAVAPYQLSLDNIKEEVVNYRDFSRRIDLDSALTKLTENNFVVIDNPFDPQVTDWQSNYKNLKDENLPIFISSDSIVGVYQDTLQIIYKEIEQEIFYPSLWELLEKMYNKTKKRYEAKRLQFGIETDTLTEANRLELAYLTVALKLLQPEESQIKESLTADKKFFSSFEGSLYKIDVPEYLVDQVNQEISLISAKKQSSKSPIFLYDNDYQEYNIPAQYQTSEILKNYYLAITWLKESFFPLWFTADDCADCLLDQQDHRINFIASLLLSNDLASDQNLKNSWANIYKSISFFKGLESNLTYLDYNQAAINVFDVDLNFDDIFATDQETTNQNIINLQNEINNFEFPAVLGGSKENKEKVGLKLLRDYHLLETSLFDSLTGTEIGNHRTVGPREELPFTACNNQGDINRCIVTGLDLFNLLDNQAARQVLTESLDDNYPSYLSRINNFVDQVMKFDQNTWHDNSYLAMLSALQNLNDQDRTAWPSFMNSEAWSKKSLSTGLATWSLTHREINFEKQAFEEILGDGFGNYFPYGYIEPQVELYNELLANVNMVMNGFLSLEIISPIGKPFQRLEALKNILEKSSAIAQKELENQTLEATDYDFINSYARQLNIIFGDIKKENIQNFYSFEHIVDKNNILIEKINGFDYIVVIYPNEQGRLFLAIGPVFNYAETKFKRIEPSSIWQEAFKL
ncbi:MAG: hypothetical protein CMI53_00580 [Parcubacteria group bacterium]|nr:hypothetical protein [Parcubacteria group bacterium]|tara:strand:- start:20179 stop:22539 length:2361 start_codon:yes stop_codon:yes gene_type:complete